METEKTPEKYGFYLVKTDGFDAVFDKRTEAQKEYDRLKTKLLNLKIGFKLQLLGRANGKVWQSIESTTVSDKYFEQEKKKDTPQK
jgi:hypothetical protein